MNPTRMFPLWFTIWQDEIGSRKNNPYGRSGVRGNTFIESPYRKQQIKAKRKHARSNTQHMRRLAK